MVVNYFIEQLEDEVVASYSFRQVLETYKFALKLNSFCLDPLVKEEDRSYINRLMDTYRKGFSK